MKTISSESRFIDPDINDTDNAVDTSSAKVTIDLDNYRRPLALRPEYRNNLIDRREAAPPVEVERVGPPILPIRVDSVSPRLNHIQASLLEEQANSISETVLFSHRNRTEETDNRRYMGLFRGPSTIGRVSRRNNEPAPPRLIGVTSAVAGEGKTTVALHIALALACNSFKKICLVDLALGKEVLCERLGIPAPVHGAVDVLEWEEQNEPSFLPLPLLQMESFNNLYLLPAGRTPYRAERTAHSPRLGDLLALTSNWSDIVVVDMPSIASGNAVPISEYLDGLVMVVQSGVTPKDVIATALDRVGRDRVLGMVMNGSESSIPSWFNRRFNSRGA